MIICPYVPAAFFRDIMEVCLCDRCPVCTLKSDIFDGVDPVDAYYCESEDKEI